MIFQGPSTADDIQIAKAVDDEVINRDLVPAFVKLLKDTEAEVRSAVAGQIPGKHVLFWTEAVH